jgi:predicted acylesterase/phospholipase RssA
MRTKSLLAAIILCICFYATIGCQSRHETLALNSLKHPASVVKHNHTRAEMRHTASTNPSDQHDDWFVGVAVSGGGSRAANFTAACFFALDDAGIMPHVRYISSVSGGSVASAYYCVSPEWDYATVQQRLTHRFQTDVLWHSFAAPWCWPNFLGDWNRTDVLASTFESVLFYDPHHHNRALTFADLRSDRPRLLLNATNLQSGRRFVFCNQSFDEINSKLSAYPIANAVAASSAFPVGLAPMPLRDHSSIDKLKRYVHLVDGGVADNSGLETLGQTYVDQVADDDTLYPNGAILLLIDSATEYNTDLSHQADIGFFAGLTTNLDLGVTQLLERARDATLSEIVLRGAPPDARADDLLKRLDYLKAHGHAEFHDHRNKPIYVVRLALKDVRHLDNIPSPGFGLGVSTIPTSFNIDDNQASDLYVAAKCLTTSRTWIAPTLDELAAKLQAKLKARSTRP